ncbi:MAG: hypothetical protein EU536_00005 [Promethearchaeota archaeon]|nr:MAG: hypothetical protein EU536_00005 [Candidatus Lokiarchaeota archaeon]
MIIEEIRQKFPNQFIALDSNNNVVASSEDIEILYKSFDDKKKVKIVAPKGFDGVNNTRRQLGWKIKRKKRVN